MHASCLHRQLAVLEEEEELLLTPFERNLEVWRQLWRVLERSDIVVQVRRWKLSARQCLMLGMLCIGVWRALQRSGIVVQVQPQL